MTRRARTPPRSDLGQLVALALGPVAPLGRRPAREGPLDRVPLDLALVPVGEVEQVADRRGPRADLDLADRVLAAADAVEPVAPVVAAYVLEVGVAIGERLLEDLVGRRHELSPVDPDLAGLAEEADAVAVGPVGDHDVVADRRVLVYQLAAPLGGVAL